MIRATVFAVLLHPSPAPSAWWVETCNARSGTQFVGRGLTLQVSKEWTVRAPEAPAEECVHLTHRKTTSVIRSCSGPSSSSGRPGARVDGAIGIRQRFIILPSGVSVRADEEGPIDLRGVAADGTVWRFIGRTGQVIEYAGVKPGSAGLFDEVLDSLCWRPEERR